MIKGIQRHWLNALLLLSFAVGCVSIITSFADMGQPFGGFLVTWRPPAKWIIDNGTPPWWPGMAQTGLTYRDQLIELDGQPFANNYPAVFEAAHAQGRATLPIKVLRDGASVNATVPVMPYQLAHVLEVKAAEFISGIVVWLIGWLLYRTRPNDELNRAAAAACAIFSMNQWVWHFTLVSARFAGLGFLDLIWLLATPFIGPTLLSFALRLVRQNTDAPLPRRQHIFLRVAYAITSALAVAHAVTRLVRLPVSESVANALRDIVYRLVVIEIFAGVFAVLAFLLIGLARRNGASLRVRRQWIVIAIGFLIALPAMAQHLYSLLSDTGSFFAAGGLDLRYLYLAVPLTLSLAVLRYQTFRSELPLLLFIAAIIVSAILASLADWAIRQLLPFAVQVFVLPPFIVVFGVLAGAFLAFQVFSHKSMPRIFRWESTHYNAAKRFGQRLAGQTDLARLPQQMTEALVDELELEQAALWLWDERERTFMFASSAGHVRIAPPTYTGVMAQLSEQGANQPVYIGADSAQGAAQLSSEWMTLRQQGFEAIAPLIALEKPVGLLALGKRWDEEIFHERDFEIIELIAQQAALFIATGQQVHTLRQVPQRVAEAQESERFKIAQELHDTVQQFLGRLPFLLEASRGLISTQPQAANDKLAALLDDVQHAARTVREIRNDLAPSQLQRGLAQPVADLVARFQARTHIETSLKIAPAVDTVLLMPARHALYRILQQALDNIEAHAQATHIDVALNYADQRVKFVIQDNGVGFAEARQAEAEADGHLGLRSMQARVAALNGELNIVSSAGQGARIEGWFDGTPSGDIYNN